MALRRIVFALAALAVGSYYLWAVRATGHPFEWHRDLSGYYDYLGQSLARGRLDLPIQPAPQLLALPNPWDPAADSTYKLWDAALFQRHYYLYHGAGPAVILFAPFRLLTHHDMPENFALFLFCFGGWLLSGATLLRILSLSGARIGLGTLTFMLLALGICSSIPYLLNRVWVYEIAIGGGYFCVSAAFFLLARSIGSKRETYWLAGSGLMFGLAVSCRPTLLLAAVAALAGLCVVAIGTRGANWISPARKLMAFAVPLAIIGMGIALYNYARFGSPFEFGIRYLLSGPGQNRIRLDAANLLPGLYYNLFCQPGFDAVFPWVRTVLGYPFASASHLPPDYFLEPTVGAFFLAPFIAVAFFVPRTKPSGIDTPRIFLVTVTASSVAILLFLAATGFVTQRYEVDFLPMAALAALGNAGILLSRSARARRRLLTCALAACIAFGIVVNLALGLSGPYDDVLKNRPAAYARLARWFSPVTILRPMMNPSLDVKFSAEFAPQPDGTREPLLTIGRVPSRQRLYAEWHGPDLRIVLETASSNTNFELASPGVRPVEIQVRYVPESAKLAVAINGRDEIVADPEIIFTAPAQVTVGEDATGSSGAPARFSGPIRILRKLVQAS